MKIESILKRPGGTKVTMGDSLYHFAPNEQDQHVAEVENPDHAKVFLNIPEGYRSLDPIQPQQVSLEDAETAVTDLRNRLFTHNSEDRREWSD